MNGVGGPEVDDWFTLRLHDGADRGEDHHAALRQKRAATPVERVALFGGGDDPGFYAVYRYDDVARVLADEATFSTDVVSLRYGAVLGARTLVALEGASRRAYRRVLLERFGPARRAELAATVEAVAAEVVDAARTGGRVDAVTALAAPLPARVLAALLGLPQGDALHIAALAAAVAGFADDPRGAVRAARNLRRRFAAAVADRRRHGGDDLVADLVAAADADDKIRVASRDDKIRVASRDDNVRVASRDDKIRVASRDDEIVALLLLLAWAGTETAFPALAGLLHALLTHPDHLAAVRANPDLVPAAVEEALRWESPVQVTARNTTTETEVGGIRLPPGCVVLLHIGSADRDEDRFADPDRYDPGRDDADRHLAFGLGPHRCVGAFLARLELGTCLRLLLERCGGLRLAGPPTAPEGQFVRSPRRLEVVLG